MLDYKIKTVIFDKPDLDITGIVIFVINRPDLGMLIWSSSFSGIRLKLKSESYKRLYYKELEGFMTHNDEMIQNFYFNLPHKEVKNILNAIDDYLHEAIILLQLEKDKRDKKLKRKSK